MTIMDDRPVIDELEDAYAAPAADAPTEQSVDPLTLLQAMYEAHQRELAARQQRAEAERRAVFGSYTRIEAFCDCSPSRARMFRRH